MTTPAQPLNPKTRTNLVGRLSAQFDFADRRITQWLAIHGITLLRISIGIVFFWFGILKFFPTASPAEDLASRTISVLTFGIITPALSLPILAVWEVAIGLGLITGRFMRITILLLLAQMLGTITPLFLFPGETWTRFLIAPTLEGQYIIKNIVLVTGAMVVGATVRGGDLVADPDLALEARHRAEAEVIA